MKKYVWAFIVSVSALVPTWFFFNHSRIGVGIRVLYQMAVPPNGLYENKVEVPINDKLLCYEIIATNSFIGCYAIRMKVPMNACECVSTSFVPPTIQSVDYLWGKGAYRQSPCRKSWNSIGEKTLSFSYEKVLVPIDVPRNKLLKVRIQFSRESQLFFREHPGCILIYGKDSDE